jgi:BirA family biotin operon repressor/biotin-[acetyl-CoA-carboxylase] ligase
LEDTGYTLLDWRNVASRRAGARIGEPLVYLPEVDSTNTFAASLLPGATAGTVVVAEHQTAGRGRLRRPWIAPSGSSLTFTVLLAPREVPWAVAMAAGLAVQEVLHGVGIEATLKWPNDVLIDGRKCAGILIESKPVDGAYWLLVGIGLNVHSADPSIPTATFLDAHASEPVSREDLLVALLASLESWLQRAATPHQVREEWRARLATIGQMVQVQTAIGPVSGTAEDVADDGALILRLHDGSRRIVQAGDVTLAATLPKAE